MFADVNYVFPSSSTCHVFVCLCMCVMVRGGCMFVIHSVSVYVCEYICASYPGSSLVKAFTAGLHSMQARRCQPYSDGAKLSKAEIRSAV